MTPFELRTLCEKLYGEHWRAVLSRKLVRDPRTIRRWASGESPVPAVVVKWIVGQPTNTM